MGLLRDFVGHMVMGPFYGVTKALNTATSKIVKKNGGVKNTIVKADRNMGKAVRENPKGAFLGSLFLAPFGGSVTGAILFKKR